MFKMIYTYGGLPKAEYDAVIAENVKKAHLLQRIRPNDGDRAGGLETQTTQ